MMKTRKVNFKDDAVLFKGAVFSHQTDGEIKLKDQSTESKLQELILSNSFRD